MPFWNPPTRSLTQVSAGAEQILTRNRARHWTSEVPTQQGFYRHVHEVEGTAVERTCVVERAARSSTHALRVRAAGGAHGRGVDPAEWGGQWLGPCATQQE